MQGCLIGQRRMSPSSGSRRLPLLHRGDFGFFGEDVRAVLEFDHAAVGAVGDEHQFVVGAGFADGAVAKHDDDIGVADGGEPVRDDEAGAALHQFLERLLHEPFAFGVERAGRLVEDQDGRVLEQRAGDGDALALAAGDFDAPLADEGRVAFGKLRR